jgi:hypothetical protein
MNAQIDRLSPDSTDRRTSPRLLEGYLSDAELCEQLDIIDRTARRWRQTGEGPPYVKIGVSVFYPVEDFHKWLKKRIQQAARGR